MQLQAQSVNAWRRRAGHCVFASMVLLATGGALSVRAEQATTAATAATYSVQLTLDAAGERSSPRVLARAGEQFAVATGAWRLEMTVRPTRNPEQVVVNSKLFRQDAVVGAPTLLVELNKQASIKVGDSSNPFDMALLVAPASGQPGR